MLNRFKNYLVIMYITFRRLLVRIASLNYRSVRRRIKELAEKSGGVEGQTGLKDKIFFLMSIKISTGNREEILRTTMKECFKGLGGQKIEFYINDSSEDKYHSRNVEYMSQFDAVEPKFRRTQVRLPGSYYDFLTQNDKPYALTVFDDFPLINLTPEVLDASCRLLEDFKGLVELVLFEQMAEFKIDQQKLQIVCNLNNLDFSQRKIKSLGIVNYQGHKFGIFENFHYGFFFSTSIVPVKDHARRLKWYLDNVSLDNPHKIELAGNVRRGPIYNTIAIPLNTFKFDLDYEHTEISIRPAVSKAKSLCEALNRGFQLILN